MRFVKGKSVVERTVRKSRILVPLGTGSSRINGLYTLNQMAAFIWDQAVAGQSDNEIIAAITGGFDVTEDQARRDAARVLEELVSIGALNAVQSER